MMKKFLATCMLILLASCGAGEPVYAADQQLVRKIIMCESSNRANVWGDDRRSYGIAQFRKETFYEFAAEAHLHHPSWHSRTQQIYLLNWALDHGYANRWTCYRMIAAGWYPHHARQK